MRLFAKCIEATSRAGFIHAQHHAGGIYRRAGHVRRNGGHDVGIPPVTFTGIVDHVPGITGHVGPEYSPISKHQKTKFSRLAFDFVGVFHLDLITMMCSEVAVEWQAVRLNRSLKTSNTKRNKS